MVPQTQKLAEKPMAPRKDIKRAFLLYYRDLLSPSDMGRHYIPNSVTRWRTKNGDHDELLSTRGGPKNFFDFEAFAIKRTSVDIHTWMRIPGHDQRYLLVVHGWMELLSEVGFRRELFHTFVLDYVADRFQIVSEVRRLGSSERLLDSDLVNSESEDDNLRNLDPQISGPAVHVSVAASSSYQDAPPAWRATTLADYHARTSCAAASASITRDCEEKKTWASLVKSTPSDLQSKQSPSHAGKGLNGSSTRLGVTPPTLTEQELWELCVDACPEALQCHNEQDFRIEKNDIHRQHNGSNKGDSKGDRSRASSFRTFLFVPNECANILVQASKRFKLKTKAHAIVKLDWAREGKPTANRPEGKKGKKNGW